MQFEIKFGVNDPALVPYKVCDFFADWNSKMFTITGPSLIQDPKGKGIKYFSQELQI